MVLRQLLPILPMAERQTGQAHPQTGPGRTWLRNLFFRGHQTVTHTAEPPSPVEITLKPPSEPPPDWDSLNGYHTPPSGAGTPPAAFFPDRPPSEPLTPPPPGAVTPPAILHGLRAVYQAPRTPRGGGGRRCWYIYHFRRNDGEWDHVWVPQTPSYFDDSDGNPVLDGSSTESNSPHPDCESSNETEWSDFERNE